MSRPCWKCNGTLDPDPEDVRQLRCDGCGLGFYQWRLDLPYVLGIDGQDAPVSDEGTMRP